MSYSKYRLELICYRQHTHSKTSTRLFLEVTHQSSSSISLCLPTIWGWQSYSPTNKILIIKINIIVILIISLLHSESNIDFKNYVCIYIYIYWYICFIMIYVDIRWINFMNVKYCAQNIILLQRKPVHTNSTFGVVFTLG